MNQKTAIRLLATLAALLLTGVFLKRRDCQPQHKNFLAYEGIKNKTAAIEISSGGAMLRFSKTSGGWLMETPFRYKADSKEIEYLLASIAEARLSDTLTSNKERYNLFELNPASATKIDLYNAAADKLLAFETGKSARDPETIYVKMADSDDVKLASGLSYIVINRPAGNWLDKTVCSFAADSINRLVFKRQKNQLKLLKGTTGWVIASSPKDTIVPQDMAEKLILPAAALLSDLKADEIVKEAAAFKPEFTVEAGAADNSVILEISAKDSADYRLVRIPGSGMLFKIQDWRLAPLKITPENFKSAKK